MDTSLDIQLGLDDLIADLQFARRNQELGRLALLAYCEIRSWARQAGKPDISESATKMFTETPCVCKDEFLARIDHIISTLERHQQAYQRSRNQFLQPASFSACVMAGDDAVAALNTDRIFANHGPNDLTAPI